MDRQQLIRLARRAAVALLAVAIVAGPAVALAGHRAGWQPLVERSASMAPRIAPGDLLLVQRLRADAMRPGDVVTFADPHVRGRTLTHRVIAIRAAAGRLAVTTRGDANRGAEHWTIAPGGTVGRLRRTVAMPEAAALLLDRSHVRGIIMMVLALLACGLTLAWIWRRPTVPCAPAR